MVDSNAIITKSKTRIELEEDYTLQIKEDKDSLFSQITTNRVDMWKQILSKGTTPIYVSDADILNTVLNHREQQIIKNDCNRTRGREAIMIDSFKDYLEFILTHYCKQERIIYKQGINEIFGPFILLKFKISISLADIYLLGKRFIDKFLTNIFRQQFKQCIDSTLLIYNILLRYHEPLILCHLEKNKVLPQLYAFNWLSTLFANKFRLDVIYQLWDYIISMEDPLMIYYVIVALIQSKKEQLLSYSEDIRLLTFITNLSIEKNEEVHVLIKNAITIKEHTPFSINYLLYNLEVYKTNNSHIKEAYDLWNSNNLLLMPLFPTEIFYQAYPSHCYCPNELCHFIKNKDSNQLEILDDDKKHEDYNKKYICAHCDLDQINNMCYLIIDLRILTDGTFENLNEQAGFLPNMIMFPQNDLVKDSFIPDLLQRFSFDKRKTHFILLTSSTDYFKIHEEKYYVEYIEEANIYGINNEPKIIKQLNTALGNTLSLEEKGKLFEYDLLKRVLSAFSNADYPYVSYAYGGYTNIHDNAFKFNIPLLNHEKNCELCKGMNKRIKKPEKNTNKSNNKQITIEMKVLERNHFIISNLHVLIPKELSSVNLPENKSFQEYNITKAVEFFLVHLLAKGETQCIECHLTIVKNKQYTIFPNCLFLLNHYEFQMYNKENQEISYIDKSLLIEIIKVDYNKKLHQVQIILESNIQILLTINTHKRGRSWYKLIIGFLNR